MPNSLSPHDRAIFEREMIDFIIGLAYLHGPHSLHGAIHQSALAVGGVLAGVWQACLPPDFKDYNWFATLACFQQRSASAVLPLVMQALDSYRSPTGASLPTLLQPVLTNAWTQVDPATLPASTRFADVEGWLNALGGPDDAEAAAQFRRMGDHAAVYLEMAAYLGLPHRPAGVVQGLKAVGSERAHRALKSLAKQAAYAELALAALDELTLF